MAMTAFGAGGWLLIATVVIYMIVLSTMKAGERNELKWLKQKGLTFEEGTTRHAYLWLLVCVAVVALLVAHFWAFFRLRRFQSDMTMAAGGIFPDSQWSFGQIVAVVIFFPVAAEMLYCWSRRPRNTI
jgi:magnesium-transporting ATPase (P-type)